jgi:hypothetical protein
MKLIVAACAVVFALTKNPAGQSKTESGANVGSGSGEGASVQAAGQDGLPSKAHLRRACSRKNSFSGSAISA